MDEHKRREMDRMDDMFGMQYSISAETSRTLCFAHSRQTAALPMFLTSPKSSSLHQH